MTNPSDIGTNREAGYVATGYRVSFPLLVYARDCRFLGDITSVPMNGSFLVSSSFISTPGDTFSDAGAGPDYIGTKVHLPTGEDYLAFRAPGPNEVIWDVTSVSLYRYYRDVVSRVYSWIAYRSLPQRGLDSQLVFSVMDPDGIYNYYAQLMGAMYSQMQYDLTVQAQTMEAATVAPKFLPYLAFQYGLTYPATDPVAVQRQQIEVAIPVFKKKGTPDGVRIRLQSLGYRGYAWEMWINPGDPTIFMFGSVTGTPEDLVITTSNPNLRAFGFDTVTFYGAAGYLSFYDWRVPTEGTTFTLSDGVTEKTFTYTAYPSVSTDILLSGSAMTILAATVTAIGAAGFSFTTIDNTKSKEYGPPIGTLASSTTARGARIPGVTESEYRLYPHNYWTEEIPVYVLSSRVVLFLKNADGSPISFPDTPQGHADAQTLKAYVANNIQYDVLPVHVDVAFFATIVDVPSFGFEALDVYEGVVTTGLSVTSGDAPLSVSFFASPSNLAGLYTYSWDFGDGGSSTDQNPTHVYTVGGTYTPTVTVYGNLIGVPITIALPSVTVTAPIILM